MLWKSESLMISCGACVPLLRGGSLLVIPASDRMRVRVSLPGLQPRSPTSVWWILTKRSSSRPLSRTQMFSPCCKTRPSSAARTTSSRRRVRPSQTCACSRCMTRHPPAATSSSSSSLRRHRMRCMQGTMAHRAGSRGFHGYTIVRSHWMWSASPTVWILLSPTISLLSRLKIEIPSSHSTWEGMTSMGRS